MSKARNLADVGSNDVLDTSSTGVDVTGTVTADGLTVDGTAAIPVTINTSVDGAQLKFNDGTASTQPWNVGIKNDGSNDFLIYNLGAENIELYTADKLRQKVGSNGDISFYEDTGTTPKFFWDASAEGLNLGAASMPFGKLDVSDVGGSGTATIFDAGANGDNYFTAGASGIQAFRNGSTERMRIDSSGNVGIGTSSPSSALHLSGASTVNARQTFTQTTAGLTGQIQQGSTGFAVSASGSQPILLETNGAERMRITAGGIIGVGLNNPTGSFSNGSGTQLGDGFLMANRTSNVCAAFGRNTTTGTIINFAYGSTSQNPATKGTISTNGSSVSYNTTSDYRLKENVVDLTGAITRLNDLDVKRFNFISDADTTVDGFLAHEVATVVPEAVTGAHNEVAVWTQEEIDAGGAPENTTAGDNKLDEDGNTIPVYQGIDQSKLVPLLTAALQEAIAKIDALETRIETLENA